MVKFHLQMFLSHEHEAHVGLLSAKLSFLAYYETTEK